MSDFTLTYSKSELATSAEYITKADTSVLITVRPIVETGSGDPLFFRVTCSGRVKGDTLGMSVRDVEQDDVNFQYCLQFVQGESILPPIRQIVWALTGELDI